MEIGVVTLFPECIEQVLGVGIPRIAIEGGQLSVSTFNPREFTEDKHRTVDDRPFGGGPGMVMKVEPLRAALHEARAQMPGAKVIYLSPQGKRFTQSVAQEYAAQRTPLVFLSGRYEGVDERLVDTEVDAELSVGDFVLSGGEIAALAVIDAVSRLLPGVLGHGESSVQDSFGSSGLLDWPHYTRPEKIDGMTVPPVLLSGDHKKIARWRRDEALKRTHARRPELLQNAELSEEDRRVLQACLTDGISGRSGQDPQ